MGSMKMGMKSQPYAGRSKAKPFPKSSPVKGATGKQTVLKHK